MSFEVDNNPGYWLFYTHRTVSYAFAETLKRCCLEQKKPYVVTPAQWSVLSLLYEGDGQTISTISQRRGFDAPTITGIVRRLERAGLVKRQHDSEDRRVVKVFLTEEGRDIMHFLRQAVEDFHAIMMGGFSDLEEATIQKQLQQIIMNVSAVAPGTGDRFGLLPQSLQQKVQKQDDVDVF